MKSNEIIKIAREWIGTPFHEQARQKHFGCDCIGLIIGIAKEIGAISLTGKTWQACDIIQYNTLQDNHMLLSEMPKHFLCINHSAIIPGDILLMEVQCNHYHICLYDTKGIIHACSSIGKVAYHKMIPNWKIISTFRYLIDPLSLQ